MSATVYPGAMFAGLVFNEKGDPAEVAYVGGVAHYVVLDNGFRRHVEAREVDRQVLLYLREQMEPYRELAVQEMMRLMGQDDIFTKAMIEASIQNIEAALDRPLPEEMRLWLGMMGFRVVINVHGEVVEVTMPGQAVEGWEE